MLRPLTFSFAALLFIAVAPPLAAQKLNVEEAVLGQSGALAPTKLLQLQWAGDGGGWSYVNEDNTLLVFNSGGRENLRLSLDDLNRLSGTSMKAFPQHTWLTTGKFRFKSATRLMAYDFKRKAVETLFELPETAEHITFSDDHKRVAFTVENNVHITTGTEPVQVTDHPDRVVAGQAIARHEFGISEGLFWSPDGSALAFYEKDERHVTAYPMPDYGKVPAAERSIIYPMAGGHSEYAALGVYHPRLRQTVYLKVNNGVRDDSYYITNVAWTPDGKRLIAAIVSRDQRLMQLIEFDASTGNQLRLLVTEADDRYVEPEHPPVFIPDNSGDFLWFSERNGFNNLYRYAGDGKFKGRTMADFPITELLGFSGKGRFAVVAGHGPSHIERQLFRVNLSDMSLEPLTTEAGTHTGQLSDDGSRIIDEWSSVDVARRTEIIQIGGKAKRVLLESENPLSRFSIGKVELGTLAADDGTELHYRMVLPHKFDKTRRYPVLVYVYNGPHVQLVTNSWQGGAPLWMHSLAGEGCIVFSLDGRGSANRGKDFEQAIFRQLGNLEIDDQMKGVEWLRSQPFIDDSRMAIHGWSYGGFMTTSLMLKRPGVFRVGVAGGPVIDWKMYEVMYTERYMDTPEDNAAGYEAADLTRLTSALEGRLLMIHGTDDDVVVLQHNMAFLKACIADDKLVDFFVYPGHAHNVRGRDRVHLMKKVFAYIFDHL